MTFNSHGFILMILPITLIGFYLIRAFGVRMGWESGRIAAACKLWLIGMSVWFLGLFGLRNLFILLVSLALNGVVLHYLQRDHSKALMALAVAANVGTLAVLKVMRVACNDERGVILVNAMEMGVMGSAEYVARHALHRSKIVIHCIRRISSFCHRLRTIHAKLCQNRQSSCSLI